MANNNDNPFNIYKETNEKETFGQYRIKNKYGQVRQGKFTQIQDKILRLEKFAQVFLDRL